MPKSRKPLPDRPPAPRPPLGAAFLISVTLLCLGALLTPMAFFFIGFQIGGPIPGEESAERGEELLREGRFGPALDQLQLAVTEGYDNSYLKLNVARCLEGLGRREEADEAFEAVIGGGHWWPAYIEKAEFLLRRNGADAAVAWLTALDRDPSDPKIAYLLGEFHHFALDDKAAAIPHYEDAVRRAASRHNFRFDSEGWLVLDQSSLQKENNDYADLWPTLEHLAACRLETGDVAGALRTATMGVAIGQQLKRCQGYYNAQEVEAGDVSCRALRVRALVRLARLDEAAQDLAIARPLAERSSHSRSARALERAGRELTRARGR